SGGKLRDLFPAAAYYRALAFQAAAGADDRKKAVAEMERYLGMESPASAWWPLARERYHRICQEQGATEKSEAELKGRASRGAPARGLRLLISVELAPGVTVTLSEAAKDAEQRLGTAEKAPVGADTRLVRLRYPRYGAELLASDQVLAVILDGAAAPPLQVRP